MKVYRFEHKHSKEGPYNAIDNITGCKAIDDNILNYTLDSPAEEGLLFYDDLCCGCSSIQQLHLWFGHVLVDLFNSGFSLISYDIFDEDVNFGLIQVTFDRNLTTKREVLI